MESRSGPQNIYKESICTLIPLNDSHHPTSGFYFKSHALQYRTTRFFSPFLSACNLTLLSLLNPRTVLAMTTTTDGYVFYLNITPERMTHEQINALRAAQDNVQRILGRLSQQADADFQSSPESNDPNPTVRSFGLARALERVFNRSGQYLSILGQDTLRQSIQVQSSRFHADIYYPPSR